VNFMFGLPAGLKIRRFRGKYLLRRAAAGLRAGSPAANPVFYFRLLLLGLWLDSVKGRGRITKM